METKNYGMSNTEKEINHFYQKTQNVNIVSV